MRVISKMLNAAVPLDAATANLGPFPMKPRLFPLALRLSCLPALAACAALALEYRSFDSAFCAPESGCSVLRRTDIAYLWGALGITLPELGLVAFALLFALSLSRRALALAAVLSVLGGLAGLLLLASQALALRTFCWLCVVVDVSAVAGATFSAAYLLQRRAGAPQPDAASDAGRLHTGAWAALAAVATLAPAVWLEVKPMPDVPAAVRAYYRPGAINVVEFTDYECPFCRRLHHELKATLAPYGSRVHLVRLNMPLERHPMARDAALAAICAEPSGRGSELAEFLFRSEDLSPARIRAEAERLAIPLAAYDACLEAPATLERLQRESRILREVGFQGLPTTYIGNSRIVGAQPPEVFQDAIERAAENGAELSLPAWVYVLLVAAMMSAIAWAGHSRKNA